MKILLYYHTGSKNHGCEAIVRTLCKIFQKHDIILYSFDAKSDMDVDLNKLVTVKQCLPRKEKYSFFEKILFFFGIKQMGAESYKEMFREKVDWAFSIGGDNYCYCDQPEELAYLNREWRSRGVKTALVGCSIDVQVLEQKHVIKDLEKYQIIIARESLTYNALCKKGLKNILLFPDSAFALERSVSTLQLDKDKEWIGLNISPLIVKKEEKNNIVYKNYLNLINYIINETNCNIVLIPHVTVEWDNDLNPIELLYRQYKDSGRIIKAAEENCQKIKDVIGQCKIIVCSRTHVSIAAYSLCIPTLVIGYSIKSEGIAKDLFGNADKYVVSVKEMQNEEELVDAYKWIDEHRYDIQEKLKNMMAEYIKKLSQLVESFE